MTLLKSWESVRDGLVVFAPFRLPCPFGALTASEEDRRAHLGVFDDRAGWYSCDHCGTSCNRNAIEATISNVRILSREILERGHPSSCKRDHIEQAAQPIAKLIAGGADPVLIEDLLRVGRRISTSALAGLDLGKKSARSEEELRTTLQTVRADIDTVEADLCGRRYIVNDTTTEKLGELMAENENGLLLVRDELAGWLRSLAYPDLSRLDARRRACELVRRMKSRNGSAALSRNTGGSSPDRDHVRQIHDVLAAGPLTGAELLKETGLPRADLYRSLGYLYDSRAVGTDGSNLYWMNRSLDQ